MKSIFAIVTFLVIPGLSFASSEPCSTQRLYLEVDTHNSTLFQCKDGHTVKSFKVSFGRGGLDKKTEGDGRTPLGIYPLGNPRPSNGFFTFIPIGYPTHEQTAKGYSGSNVGVHGPFQYLAWLGQFNTWFNWTNGCIATGTFDEISEIAKWVRENHVTSISIH